MARRPRKAAPTNRNFTLSQTRHRLKGHVLELIAIGGAYYLTKGEIRARLLALVAAVQETLDRFPPF